VAVVVYELLGERDVRLVELDQAVAGLLVATILREVFFARLVALRLNRIIFKIPLEFVVAGYARKTSSTCTFLQTGGMTGRVRRRVDTVCMG